MPRLTPLGPELWHVTHHFKVGWMPVSTRMTVVRLTDRSLWLHSPIPLDQDLLCELAALGEVRAIVAPNKTHHLFLSACAATFPNATVHGAPGLADKRPDLSLQHETTCPPENWGMHFDQVFIEGIPFANETVWFHRASATLIVTDLVQCWDGALPWSAHVYARLTGVRGVLAMPLTVRALVRDRAAFQRCAERILVLPFERIVMAHNTVIEANAHAQMRHALRAFLN